MNLSPRFFTGSKSMFGPCEGGQNRVSRFRFYFGGAQVGNCLESKVEYFVVTISNMELPDSWVKGHRAL